jgi:hypothetical protein
VAKLVIERAIEYMLQLVVDRLEDAIQQFMHETGKFQLLFNPAALDELLAFAVSGTDLSTGHGVGKFRNRSSICAKLGESQINDLQHIFPKSYVVLLASLSSGSTTFSKKAESAWLPPTASVQSEEVSG